jgi:hypothetical protein
MTRCNPYDCSITDASFKSQITHAVRRHPLYQAKRHIQRFFVNRATSVTSPWNSVNLCRTTKRTSSMPSCITQLSAQLGHLLNRANPDDSAPLYGLNNTDSPPCDFQPLYTSMPKLQYRLLGTSTPKPHHRPPHHPNPHHRPLTRAMISLIFSLQ